jgi:hypothetical protein
MNQKRSADLAEYQAHDPGEQDGGCVPDQEVDPAELEHYIALADAALQRLTSDALPPGGQ